MDDTIFVTVICVTYNHQDYIKDALESFLHQQVSYKYEIVVHDDASTDQTADILREYEQRYPDKIRVIYEAVNLYQSADNFVKCIQESVIPLIRGKYVLISEGDDYWIDETKLQRQVEYLEQHDECTMVTHNAVSLHMKSTKIDIQTRYYKDKNLSPEEIINHPCGYLATASMLMRRECFELKGFFHEAGIGDYTRQLYCLAKGKVHYIDRIMSVYRFGHAGSWQESQDKDSSAKFYGYLKMIRFLDKYNAYTSHSYDKYLRKEIQRYAHHIIRIGSKEDLEKFLVKELYDEPFWKYLKRLEKLHGQIKDPHYLADMTASFLRKYKHILIMGAGKYASVLAGQIRNNGEEFDGFVVSPGQNPADLYCGKKVYTLDEIPYEKNDTGILVGINATVWDEVEETLLKYEIRNYYCPFLLDLDDNNTNI